VWSEIERMYVHHVQLADVYHDNEKVNLLLKEISTNHTEKTGIISEHGNINQHGY
jgi:hypothetical protein